MCMMVKLPHADHRNRHLSVNSAAFGHKPYDLATLWVCDDSTIADLHYIIQIAEEWSFESSLFLFWVTRTFMQPGAICKKGSREFTETISLS
jgi:hypothetical protein